MNNINKGNEIRLCSIEQHHTDTTYWFIIILLFPHSVYVKWIISLIDIADKKK